jgi:hypothetical protein
VVPTEYGRPLHGGDFLDPNQLARGVTESYAAYKMIMAHEGVTKQRIEGVEHNIWRAPL